jgi:hypothetical protein
VDQCKNDGNGRGQLRRKRCPGCGEWVYQKGTYCSPECREKVLERNRIVREERKAMGLCQKCPNDALPGLTLCSPCRDKNRATNSKSVRRVKLTVFEHYGLECPCCGESNIQFLQLDHKDGQGCEERRQVKLVGDAYYRWVIAQGFPDYLQVLCAGCNFAKRNGTECPHEQERRDLIDAVAKIPMTY